MVGVVGSNPIVSTNFVQPLSIRDAEECRELAPRQEFFPAEADSFAVARRCVTVERKKQLRLLFLFLRFVCCHPREGGDPDRVFCETSSFEIQSMYSVWVPAFAGMTAMLREKSHDPSHTPRRLGPFF
jgi:hypothetical protein